MRFSFDEAGLLPAPKKKPLVQCTSGLIGIPGRRETMND